MAQHLSSRRSEPPFNFTSGTGPVSRVHSAACLSRALALALSLSRFLAFSLSRSLLLSLSAHASLSHTRSLSRSFSLLLFLSLARSFARSLARSLALPLCALNGCATPSSEREGVCSQRSEPPFNFGPQPSLLSSQRSLPASAPLPAHALAPARDARS
eukprot:3917185-Rhodomonas_salina.2